MGSLLGIQAQELAGAFDLWGETLRFFPGGGSTYIERVFIVDRQPRPTPRREDPRAHGWACTLYLRRDADLGRLTIATTDRVEVPLAVGSTATMCRIARAVATDHGLWTLEAIS